MESGISARNIIFLMVMQEGNHSGLYRFGKIFIVWAKHDWSGGGVDPAWIRITVMKFLIFPLIVLWVAGCATSQSKGTTTEVEDSYELLLAPQGGEYAKWTKHLNGGFCQARVRLQPESVSPHKKWASLARVLLKGDRDSEVFYVSAQYDPDDKLLKDLYQTQAGHHIGLDG